MKISFLPGLLLAALIAVSAPEASAKKKHKPKPASGPQTPDYSEPSEALAPYITHLDQLLALHRTAPKDVMPLLNEASGKIAIARMEFTAQKKTAAAEDQAEFNAGIATCDALTRALDDRQKVLGDIQASSSVKGSGRLSDGPRKDNLTQGIHGDGFAKGVGSIVERDREKAATAAAKKSAKETDNSLTAMSINRWNARAIEWRKFITDAYAKTK